MVPSLIFRALVNKKYLPNLRERTGLLNTELCNDGRQTIWIHACSVGEVLSVQPLAHLLKEKFPDSRLVFSVTTQSGRRVADERFLPYGKENIFYFPIDLPLFVNRVLRRIKPDILVMIDTEIWPNMVHACHNRQIPVVLANGRISDRSFKYYRWAKAAMGEIFSNYSRLLMKDQEDAERIQQIGAPPSKIIVAGNMKFDRDIVEKTVAADVKQSLDQAFSLSSLRGPLLVAGSTHEGEEAILLDVLLRLRSERPEADIRLLLVPRHPERFEIAAGYAQKRGLAVARRSLSPGATESPVLLLDTVGELAAAYQFATIAFVGGTLIPHGGQSIMEPALYGKPIVVGPHTENFPGAIKDFRANSAILEIAADERLPTAQADQLFAALLNLLDDKTRRNDMGDRAQSLFARSQGATALIVSQIARVLKDNV